MIRRLGRDWRLVERGCAVWSCGQSVARRVRRSWFASLGEVRRWMARLRSHAASTFSEGFVAGLSWCVDLAVWSCGESAGRADCRCVSLLGGCRWVSVRLGAHAASTANGRVVVGGRRGAGSVVWSCGESAGRADCLLVLPGELRRWVLAGQGSHVASARSERSVTVLSRRLGRAVWSCGGSVGRAVGLRNGQLGACRWWATLLGEPDGRGCQLWKGRSFTANGHELRELVTISTRSDGGAA